MATNAISSDQDVVTAEIFIAAPPERVFQAMTDPAETSQWWGQKGMYRITERKADFRVGGKYSSVGVREDGTSFRVDGEYLEIDPPRLLVHTWIASRSGSLKTIVRWELSRSRFMACSIAVHKRLERARWSRVRHEGFAGAPKAAADHDQGWTRVLGWLQAFVEKGEAVDTREI